MAEHVPSESASGNQHCHRKMKPRMCSFSTEAQVRKEAGITSPTGSSPSASPSMQRSNSRHMAALRRMSTFSTMTHALTDTTSHQKDVVHIHTHQRLLESVHRLAYGPPVIVLAFFLVIYVGSALLFGALYFSFGASCFHLEDESHEAFTFAVALWISVHVFSTVGFGNVAPRQSCDGAQVVVLIESFCALLVTAAIGGYVCKMFLRPLSSMRFSRRVLINHGRRRVMLEKDVGCDDEGQMMGGRRCSADGRSHSLPGSAPSKWASQESVNGGGHGEATNGHGAAGAEARHVNVRARCDSSGSESGGGVADGGGSAEGGGAEGGGGGGDCDSGGPSLDKTLGPNGLNVVRPRKLLRRLSNNSWSPDQAAVAYRFITFRMVRQGRVQLRDVRVQLQANYWVAGTTAFGDRDSHKGRVVTLKLEQDYFTTLEQLQVWHRIDEESPLWRMRDTLMTHLDGLEVSVSAFDMAALQQVQFYKRYAKQDVLSNHVFQNNLAMASRLVGRTRKTYYQCDHSKLDNNGVEMLTPERLTGLGEGLSRPRRRRPSQDGLKALLAGTFDASKAIASATHTQCTAPPTPCITRAGTPLTPSCYYAAPPCVLYSQAIVQKTTSFSTSMASMLKTASSNEGSPNGSARGQSSRQGSRQRSPGRGVVSDSARGGKAAGGSPKGSPARGTSSNTASSSTTPPGSPAPPSHAKSVDAAAAPTPGEPKARRATTFQILQNDEGGSKGGSPSRLLTV